MRDFAILCDLQPTDRTGGTRLNGTLYKTKEKLLERSQE